MNYWKIKDKMRYIVHPFKYGFWCKMCVGKQYGDKFIKLAMFWETYDSYAGDGDYGIVYAWTGNRKTWKEFMRKLNVEMARINGWIHSKEEAKEEFGLSGTEINQYWDYNLKIGIGEGRNLLGLPDAMEA